MSNKLITVIVCAFSLALLLCSCAQQSTTSTTSSNWWPHVDGYSWTYNTAQTYTEGVNQQTTISTESWTFNGTGEVAGLTAQKLSYSSRNDPQYYLINSAGAYQYGTVAYPTTETTVMLSYPLSTGKTWQITSTVTAEVLARESVTVPAGSYDAYKIIHDIGSIGSGSYSLFYFAENVGLVKAFYYITNIPVGNGLTTFIATYELTAKSF